VSLSRRSLPSLRAKPAASQRHQQNDRAGRAATFSQAGDESPTRARLLMERQAAGPLGLQRIKSEAVEEALADMAAPAIEPQQAEFAPKASTAHSHVRQFALAKISLRPALLAVTATCWTRCSARGLGHANGQICRLDKKRLDRGRGRQGHPQWFRAGLIEVIHSNGST